MTRNREVHTVNYIKPLFFKIFKCCNGSTEAQYHAYTPQDVYPFKTKNFGVGFDIAKPQHVDHGVHACREMMETITDANPISEPCVFIKSTRISLCR